MKASGIRERVAEYLRRKHGVALCAACVARALAADEGRVRYTLVLLEGSQRFPRGNGRCGECGHARLVSRFVDAAAAPEAPPDGPAPEEPDTWAAELPSDTSPDGAVAQRPKCVRCSFVIGAADRTVVSADGAYHDYCWQLLSSARVLADARRLTRDSRARSEKSRGRSEAEPPRD